MSPHRNSPKSPKLKAKKSHLSLRTDVHRRRLAFEVSKSPKRTSRPKRALQPSPLSVTTISSAAAESQDEIISTTEDSLEHIIAIEPPSPPRPSTLQNHPPSTTFPPSSTLISLPADLTGNRLLLPNAHQLPATDQTIAFLQARLLEAEERLAKRDEECRALQAEVERLRAVEDKVLRLKARGRLAQEVVASVPSPARGRKTALTFAATRTPALTVTMPMTSVKLKTTRRSSLTRRASNRELQAMADKVPAKQRSVLSPKKASAMNQTTKIHPGYGKDSEKGKGGTGAEQQEEQEEKRMSVAMMKNFWSGKMSTGQPAVMGVRGPRSR